MLTSPKVGVPETNSSAPRKKAEADLKKIRGDERLAKGMTPELWLWEYTGYLGIMQNPMYSADHQQIKQSHYKCTPSGTANGAATSQ